MSCRFLVIGAGPTGIGAATRLTECAEGYALVEAADGVGGMAASVKDAAGFTWDLGGHVLHSHFPEFDRAIEDSDVRMNSVRRNGWVWLDGELTPTLIQSNLAELPTDVRRAVDSANLAEYYLNEFGADLYERFFGPYTFKMWTTPLSDIDHSWTSLRSGSTQRNVPSLGLAKDFVPSEARFPYPQGGTGALWTAVAGKLLDPNRLLLGTQVVDIDLTRRDALLSTGQHVRYEHCISTAPITP